MKYQQEDIFIACLNNNEGLHIHQIFEWDILEILEYIESLDFDNLTKDEEGAQDKQLVLDSDGYVQERQTFALLTCCPLWEIKIETSTAYMLSSLNTQRSSKRFTMIRNFIIKTAQFKAKDFYSLTIGSISEDEIFDHYKMKGINKQKSPLKKR